MISVVLTGHGHFASGLTQALLQITGEHPQFRAIDFPESKSSEQLEQEMREAITELDSGEGVVFLTDILGGTPFRTASLLTLESPNIEVVTGTNLQLLTEMLLERDELSLNEFREQAVESGLRGITSYFHQQQTMSQPEDVTDGI
ncbi:PTS galactosamine/N-acetylgalactosamine transporter subunit IIA [Dongshaea marina]|uniref:PTS galactosamine/N-acetylgalactosamine transporter subunit IIA n=1 Tax=Dongshaea marina TaxID=2047966 RepID=UPI000D3EB0EE|nr:PTS galactosamine/N-acetylgalactosamine transporter subunit IIA [Dongshaea marina]